MRRDLQGGIWAGRNYSIAAYRNILKGTAALLALAGALPEHASASSFNVGGGTITTTDTDNFVDNTGTGGSFELQANSTTTGDLVTISGVTVDNIGSNAKTIEIGGGFAFSPLASTGSYTVRMNGSSLLGDEGTHAAVFLAWTASGTATLDTTGGAPNTISGRMGYVVQGDISVIKTGADVINTSWVPLYTTAASSITIESVGATLTSPFSLYGIEALSDGGSITIGGANGGFASTINTPNGTGIRAVTNSAASINITLAPTGVINASTGIELRNLSSGTVFADIYGTINTPGGSAISSLFSQNAIFSLHSGSTTIGGLQGNFGNTTYNIFTGADIGNTTFHGTGSLGHNIGLRGTGLGTFDVSTATDIPQVAKYDSGTWTLTRSSVTGASTAAFSVNAGTLIGSTATIAGNVSIGSSGTLQFDQGTSGTYGSIISGNGTLQKTNSGTLTLTGNNTYSGDTILNAGTISLGSNAALGTGSLTTFGSVVDYADGVTINNPIVVNSNTTQLQVLTGTATQSGVISESGGARPIEKIGAGTLILTATNTYTGNTTVSAGTLIGTVASIPGNLTVAAGGSMLFDQASPGAYSNSIDNSGNVTFAGESEAGTATIANNAGAFLRFEDDTSAGDSTITNDGTITFTDTASAGNSTITNNSGGVLAFQSLSAAQDLQIVNNAGANIDITGMAFPMGGGPPQITIGSIDGAGSIALGDRLLVLGSNSSSMEVSGIISGNLIGTQLVKNGGGTLILSGNNTFTGETNVTVGTLHLGNGGTAGSVIGNIGYAPSTIVAFDRADTVTYGNRIFGGGELQQIGSGTTILTANSNGGLVTTISNGTLQLGDGGTTGSLTGNVTNDSILAVNRSNTFVFPGTISGTGQFRQIGTGTTVLSANNTYTGGTEIVAGTLRVGLGSTGSVVGNVTNNSILAFNRSNEYQFDGVISGSGQVLQMGTGVTILTGNNTYSGGTTLNAGTISLGSDTALGTGSLTTLGSVVDYANGVTISNPIIVNSNTTQLQVLTGIATQSGVISETGGARPIEKIGAGTLILTAANAYNGGTTISAGTLQIGNGGATASIAGNIANYGTLAVDRTGTLNLSGNISGTGAVTITGGVALTLSGNNTYSGGTTLNAGTISLGSSSALGTGTLTTNGSVVDYASGVTINNPIVVNSNTTQLQVSAGTATQSGVISQSGGPRPIEKIGAGTLAITAANTYTGGTTVSAGTLQLGNGGTTGSIAGNVTNNGTLAFNRSNAYLFAGVISGTGAVAHNGTGVTTLSAVSAYTGATTVNAGTLSVDGSIAASSGVTVNAGGTISGTGAVASTTINGGTLAPGNSVGTITVNGNLTFTGNSTYAVEVAPNAADLTTVTGVATLAGTLQATALGGTYMPGTQFTLIDAVGGVSGTFGMLSVAGNFTTAVRPRLAYDATRVYLVLDPNMISPFLSGATANETAAARALDQVFAGGNAPSSFLNLFGLSAGALNAAMASFSGEIHGSVRTAALDESRFVREAVMKRLNAAVASETVTQDGNAIWGVAFGSWGHTASDGNAGRFDRNIGGFLAGIDRTVASAWRLGLAAGYSYSNGTAGGLAGSKSDSAAHVAAYAGNTMGPWRVRLGAANAWNNFSTDRIAAFTGFSDRLKADYSGLTTQVFGEAGFRIDMDQIPVEPFTGLTYVNLQTGSFREAGGAAALNGIAATHNVTFSTLGFRSGNIIGMMDGMISVHGTAAWLHAFEAGAPRSTLALATSGASFFASGVPIAQDSALIEIGAGASLAQGVNLSLDYTGRLASAFADHGVKGYASWRF